MTITQNDIIARIRTAIDDIVPEASDSFTDDTDTELWQAVQHAVEQLLADLPLNMLVPRSLFEDAGDPEVDNLASVDTNGVGLIRLPSRFLRFVSLKMGGWISPLYTLIEPGSDEEIRQRSAWGRGSVEKPRAMITNVPEQDGQQHYYTQRCIRFWTAAHENNAYVRSISELNYIPMPVVTEESTSGNVTTPASIDCALRPEAEKLLVYQAAAIFFEGKKEPETAEKFRNI